MKIFSKKPQKEIEAWNHYNPLRYVTSFSKAITVIWLFLFMETIFFSQIATVLSLGDAMAIQATNQMVSEIGVIIAGFYFASKTFENVAQGYERFKLEQQAKKDASDDDVTPVM